MTHFKVGLVNLYHRKNFKKCLDESNGRKEKY